MDAARKLASLSKEARWRDLGDGTLEVETTTNGPVERYRVFSDGTTTLVASFPKSFADKWALRIGCGGCLVLVLGPVVVGALWGETDWIGLPVLLFFVLLAVAEALSRHSHGDVSRYLQHEGGEEGWRAFE